MTIVAPALRGPTAAPVGGAVVGEALASDAMSRRKLAASKSVKSKRIAICSDSSITIAGACCRKSKCARKSKIKDFMGNGRRSGCDLQVRAILRFVSARPMNAGYRSWSATLLSVEMQRSVHALANAEDRRSAERRQHDSDSIGRLRFLGELFVLREEKP